VSPLRRKTEEERAATADRKARERLEAQRRKRIQQLERQRDEFFRTPAGQARLAFDRGDHVFQYSIDVMNQKPIIVAMIGSATAQRTNDPVAILNSVCHEGWELLNGSFVFVEQGQQSRDKLMSSGQNIAIRGTTVGYYLFRRSEANRREQTKPWEMALAEAGAGDYYLACSDCDGELSPADETCPHCGAPIERQPSVPSS
jgi:hypothetical protein